MKDKTYSYLFTLPCNVVYFVLFILPAIAGIYYSFMHWDMFSTRFAGLDNFKDIFTNPGLSISIKNTLIFTVSTTFFKTFIGIVLAVFLNRELKTRNFLRSVYFFPVILNTVTVGLIFSALLHPIGPVDNLLINAGFGFLAQDWLGDPKLAIFTVSGIEVWKWTGVTMVIFLAGLQSVSKEYYESAEIDGATSLQKFWKITFPLVLPAFNNSFVLSLIGGLKVFDIIYVTTGGGPGSASEVLGTIIFKSFASSRYGLACAGNLALGIIVMIIVMAFYPVLRKREVEL